MRPQSSTGLYWSIRGTVLSAKHAKDIDDDRWASEEWGPLPEASQQFQHYQLPTVFAGRYALANATRGPVRPHLTGRLIRPIESRTVDAFCRKHSSKSGIYSATVQSVGPRRKRADDGRRQLSEYSCPRCGNKLLLSRKHTSPPRLGPLVTTEYYRCDACDSGFQFTPSTGRWKPWLSEED